MSLYLPEGFLIKTEENTKALSSFENFKEAYQKEYQLKRGHHLVTKNIIYI